MHAKEVNLQTFFDGGVKYVSPSFQRPYGWKRSLISDYVERMFRADSPGCFLGAVVVMDLDTAPDGCSKRLLVDGTHRIMTLHAILLALRDEAATGTDPHLAAALQTAFFLHPHEDGHTSFKCIVPRKDRAVYEAIVRALPSPSPSSAFLRAYRFARDAFRNVSRDRLHAAAAQLSTAFTMVTLTLERDEDPYPIFKLLSPPNEAFTRQGLREYTLFSADPELMALVAGGESRELEFKERTLKCGKGACPSVNEGAFGILRSVAGFMNSPSGGTLLIGIRDDGTIRGVEDEFALVDRGKSNWDGYQLFLSNVLRSRLSTRNPILHYTITRRRARDHEVCMIKVKPGDAPVYIDKRLYVRAGNQTVEMLGPDLINYVATRWPSASATPPQ